MAKPKRLILPGSKHGHLRPVVSDPTAPQLTAAEVLELRQPTHILVVSHADGKVYIPEMVGDKKTMVCVQDLVKRLRDERARVIGKQVVIPGSAPLPDLKIEPPKTN